MPILWLVSMSGTPRLTPVRNDKTLKPRTRKLGNQALFEAYIGIEEHYLANQQCVYQSQRQWLRYTGRMEKEALPDNMLSWREGDIHEEYFSQLNFGSYRLIEHTSW